MCCVSHPIVFDCLRPHVAHQVPLSVEFPRQEYLSGLPFPSPEDLPNPGIKPGPLHCRQILYHLSSPGSPVNKYMYICIYVIYTL